MHIGGTAAPTALPLKQYSALCVYRSALTSRFYVKAASHVVQELTFCGFLCVCLCVWLVRCRRTALPARSAWIGRQTGPYPSHFSLTPYSSSELSQPVVFVRSMLGKKALKIKAKGGAQPYGTVPTAMYWGLPTGLHWNSSICRLN